MANKFQLKRTTVSGRTANTTDAGNTAFIDKGELAVNLADRKVFSSDSSNAIFEIGSNLTNLSVTSNIILNNDAAVNFKTLAGYNVKFKHQSDDNFVFYTTDTTGGERAVFAIYANTNTSNLEIITPINFQSNAYIGRLSANGSLGDAGQVLTSNGSTIYWQSLASVATNVNATYAWTNTHSFAANVSFGNSISLTTGNSSASGGMLFFAGLGDSNWKMGRNTNGTTKWFYTNNTIDIISAGSPLEGVVIGQNGGNTFFETGYAGTFIAGNVTIGNTSSKSTINSTAFSGTANNSNYLGGNSASDLRTYSDTKAATAYSNAVTYTDTKIGTANTAMAANAATAYTNAVSYTDTKIATANTAMAANAAAAYSNAVTYTDTKIGTANTAMVANAAAAYSNAVTYTDTKIGTANTAMVANAAAAYTNAVSYTDTKIGTANTAMIANAGAAYTNAIAYSANASRLTSGTVAEPRLPYRMDQDVRTTDNVEFVNITVTGNITVSGTQTVIGGNSLSITDNMIYMNQGVYATISNISGNGSVVTFTAENNFSPGWDVFVSGVDPSSYNGNYQNILAANATHFQVSNTNTAAYVSGGMARGKTDQNPDLGFAFGYNDGSYHHGGFFRDASDGIFKVFDNYAPEPDDSVYIDTSNSTFHLANFQANVIYVGNTTAYSTINTTSFSGTANNATNLGGSSLATVQSQITGNAATAYTNAVSYTDTKIGTANTAMAANAAAAYSNAVTYIDTKIGTANTAMVANAAAAYSNSVTYTDTKIGTANTAMAANAAAAYSNAVTYIDTKIGTANTAMAANAAAAYSNAVTYIDTKIGTANTAITSNAATAYTNATTFAANATNLTNGTIPYARFPANIVNTSAAFTLSGIITHGANVVLGTVGLSANGGFGTAGQVLHSNGTATYWATDDNTTYDLLAVANTAVNAGLLRLKDVNNSNDTVTFTGTGAATVLSNASHIIINATDTNETYVIKNIANSIANEARIELLPTDNPSSNTIAKFIGGGTTVVSSNTTAVLITSADQYVGTVTSVTGGSGLTGSVTASGALAVGAGSGITVNADDVAVNAQTGLIANATGLYVNSTYIASVTSLSANNADYLDGQHGSYYTNATNITTGTLSYAQIPANVINTTAAFTRTGITTFSANVVLGSVGVSANASFGTAGHVLHSNGTATYWAADDQGVTSVATGNGLTGGTITATGTVSVLANTGIVANATGLFVNSAYIATLTSNAATYSNTITVADTRAVVTTPETVTGPQVRFDFKQSNTESLSDGSLYFGEMTFRPYGSGTDWSGGPSYQLGFSSTNNLYHRSGNSTTWGSWGRLYKEGTLFTPGANVILGSVGLSANGGFGTAGHVLHSNGTATYWAADDDTNTTYDLLAVANTAANAGLLRLKDSSNANDTVTFAGTGTSTVSSNATHVIINSADQYVGTVTSVATANGLSGGTITSTGTLGVTTGSTLTVNTAGIHVNSALSIASLALSGDLTVSGNLTVSGTRTYVNTTTLDVGDNIITLNADLGAVAPSQNAGIEIMRGTSANVQFLWDETNDRWSTNGQPMAVSSLVAAGAASGITTLATGNTTITGFANVTSTLQVGTNTATFGTAAYIVANGNVGIGTSTPSAQLSMYSSTNTTLTMDGDSTILLSLKRSSDNLVGPAIILNKARGTTAARTAVASGDLMGAIRFQAFGGTTDRLIATINGAVETYVSDTDISSYLMFTTSSAGTVAPIERMRIVANGNVGIGNATPAHLLSVQGTAALGNTTTTGFANVTSTLQVGGVATFAANANFDSGVLFVDGTNNRVGVNTTTPQHALDVNAGVSTNIQASFGASISSGVWTGIHFGYTEAGNSLYRKSALVFERQDGAARGKIHILNNAQNGSDSATLADSKVTVQYDGNTGIGNTAPTHKLSVNGTGYFGDDLTVNGGQVYTGAVQARVKYAVWSDATYGIGMKNSYTYGGLNNDYAMSFQMSNDNGRGFWWGDSSHTDAQGAMALSTDGKLTVAHSARIGFGESDTTIPGSTYALEVNGAFAATTKSFLIDHPTKPDMKLRYGSLEGPENGVYVRGRLKDSNTIELPDYWTGLVDEDTITVNLTAIGKSQDLWVEDIADNKVIVGGENINCFYTVFAERKDVDKLEVEF